MAIVTRCECGNRISLADALAGRTIPCPKCGRDVRVPAAPAGAAPAARRKADNTPAVSISPTIMISAIVIITLLIIGLVIYFGPWTVGNQWAAMSKQANTNVTDVVQYALQAYDSEHGTYDASRSHNIPMVQGDAVFIPPAMVMTLPHYMIFTGKTNQGNYIGKYDTTDGEVEADIEVGGWTVGGLVDARKAPAKFHMTGREKDGVVSAESDGQPLKIIVPKHDPDAPRD